MEHITCIIKIFGAAFTAIITYLFGGVDAIMGILLAFIVIDYLTGILAAIYNKQLSSEIGFKGILKKVAILCIVCIGHLAGQATGIESIRSFVIGFYIANEGLSILENVGRTGVEYPTKLKEILSQLNDTNKAE